MSNERFEALERLCQSFSGAELRIIDQDVGLYAHFHFAKPLGANDWRCFVHAVLLQTRFLPAGVRWRWAKRDLVVYHATFVQPPT